MVSLDYTILIQMANFILLIFILRKLLYVPILGVMNERKERMEESDGEVKRLKQEVEQKFSEYEEKVRLAKLDAMEQRNAIVKEGADLAKSMIDAVRSEIPALMEQLNARITREVDAARAILRSQSRKISLEIAEKVLGRSIQ
ncbi:MAG: ATP synthase F0 subunit B [Syntrophales bacterium]|nr:ATP synthase F0 subunit B [Syntrophales bacterium]